MSKHEEGGMTDLQYKGMLIDQIDKWETLLKLTETGDKEAVLRYIQRQIELIQRKLRF